MLPAEFARKIRKTPAYVSLLLSDTNPSSKSGTIQPRRAVLEKIAEVLNKPPELVREVFVGTGRPRAASEDETDKLLRYYNDLPRECQLDVLALTEALWRRRRAEGKTEKTGSDSGSETPAAAETSYAEKDDLQEKKTA